MYAIFPNQRENPILCICIVANKPVLSCLLVCQFIDNLALRVEGFIISYLSLTTKLSVRVNVCGALAYL